jgi:hypothetical protein
MRFLIITLLLFNHTSIAEEYNPAARFNAAKQQTVKLPNHKQLYIDQSNERTIVIGTMINRQNIYAVGENVQAAGIQLNIGKVKTTIKEKFNRQPTPTIKTGERLDLEATKGSVYIRLTTNNQANIIANAKGNNFAKAEAAAQEITISGVRGIIDIKTHTTSRGNLSASANARKNVEAQTHTTQTNIQGNPRLVRIRGNITNQGDIKAKATGGIAAALVRAGER